MKSGGGLKRWLKNSSDAFNELRSVDRLRAGRDGVRAHGSAVQLDEAPDDREAQPEPAMGPRRPRVGLTERLEHVRQEIGMNARTRVLHDDVDGVGAPRENRRDDAA